MPVMSPVLVTIKTMTIMRMDTEYLGSPMGHTPPYSHSTVPASNSAPAALLSLRRMTRLSRLLARMLGLRIYEICMSAGSTRTMEVRQHSNVYF